MCVTVGGGTAGSIIAARLTEDPEVTVLVLEAGDDDAKYPDISVPGKTLLLYNTHLMKHQDTVPQTKNCLGMISNVHFILNFVIDTTVMNDCPFRV